MLAVLALPGAAAAHPGHGPEQVLVGRGAFTLPKVTIGTGDTVVWLWSGPDLVHSVTADPGQAESFDSDPSGTAGPPRHDARRGRGRSAAATGRDRPGSPRGCRAAARRPSRLHRQRASNRARADRAPGRRWRARRDFDVRALRGRNAARLPLRGLEPGGYRVRLTACDRTDTARARWFTASGCARAPSGEPQRRRRPAPRDGRRPARARRPRRPPRGAPDRSGSRRRSGCGCSSSWASPSRASDAPCG
jgi:hypothetical protein